MSDEPLQFKHVRNGEPFPAADLPKLPPAALRVMLEKLRAHGVADAKLDATAFAAYAADIACEVVALSLRRMDKTVQVADIEQDEDYEMVVRAYVAIQRANPALFPASPAAKAPAVVESPNAAPPA